MTEWTEREADVSLVRKLELYTRLSGDDRRALKDLCSNHVFNLDRRKDLISEGDKPEHINIFISGWACRYKILESGRRQIIAVLLPGDICDNNVFVLREMDHSIGTITDATIAEVTREQLQTVTAGSPRIADAFAWESHVNTAIQREKIVSLGQRDAFQQIGHLLCELYVRLESVGAAQAGTCWLPLTQTDLSEACGLSAVHINRSLQSLKSSGLIILKGRMLTIPDLEALRVACLFNPNYLHLDREGRHLDANED